MLIVVKRYQNRDIDVLDTDDNVVERINFDDAQGLCIRISGLSLNNGLSRMAQHFNGDRSQLRNIQVYWGSDYGSDLYTLDNDFFSIKNIVDKAMLSNPVGYLMLFVLTLSRCDKYNAVFHIYGKSCQIDSDDNESYLLMLLYALYSGIEIKVEYGGVDITPDLCAVKAGCEIIEVGRSVLFCDLDCTLKVSKKLLSSFSNLNSMVRTKAKFATLSTNNISLVSGEIFVKDCHKLVIKDNKTYVFRDIITIDDFTFIDNGAKLKFESGTVLDIKHITLDTDNNKLVNLINSKLNNGSIEAYNVRKSCVYKGIFTQLANRSNSLNVCIYNVIDIKTADAMLEFAKFIAGDSLKIIEKVEPLNDIIMYHNLKMLGRMDSFSLLSDYWKKVFSLSEYVEFGYEGLYERTSKHEILEIRKLKPYAFAVLSGKQISSYMKEEDVKKGYDELMKRVETDYYRCKEVADFLKRNISVSDMDYGFFVKHDYTNVSGVAHIHNMDEYKVFKDHNQALSDLIMQIYNSTGYYTNITVSSTMFDSFVPTIMRFVKNEQSLIPVQSDFNKIVEICMGVEFKIGFDGKFDSCLKRAFKDLK